MSIEEHIATLAQAGVSTSIHFEVNPTSKLDTWLITLRKGRRATPECDPAPVSQANGAEFEETLNAALIGLVRRT